MAINRSSISAQPISQNRDVAIQMLTTRPVEGVLIDPPVTPHILCGYYNEIFNVVELYVTSFDGTEYLRVR